MQTGARRALSEGEIALGRVVFGDEIGWAKVRIVQAPRLGFGAMRRSAAHHLFPIGAARDFRKARAEQGWLVHELAHVWQSAHGMFLPALKLGALGKGASTYNAMKTATLRDYNIERQAEIVRHLWLARMGACAEGAPDRAWLEAMWESRFKGRSRAA